jgi:hypothetical protein
LITGEARHVGKIFAPACVGADVIIHHAHLDEDDTATAPRSKDWVNVPGSTKRTSAIHPKIRPCSRKSTA